MEKVSRTPEKQIALEVAEKSASSGDPALTAPLNIWQRIWALILALRPRQWTKNLAIFIGLVFAGHLFNLLDFERALLAFCTFCLVASSIYLLNDLLDLQHDRLHPVKCKRPLASGRLPKSWAIGAIGVLLLLCAALISLLFSVPIVARSDTYAGLGGSNWLFALTIVSYFLIMVLYGVRLKHVVLIDVFIIASGFVLRILAGAIVVPVLISPWLYIVTSQLSLFLALCKRRNELILLQGEASNHRQILKEYSIPMLDQMITIVVTTTIMAYSLYTFQGPTGNHRLILTLPLVLYGLFRYLYLVYIKGNGGSPEEILLRDPHMIGTVLLCTGVIVTVLYLLPQ